jgi:hypothetical protein
MHGWRTKGAVPMGMAGKVKYDNIESNMLGNVLKRTTKIEEHMTEG